MSLQEDRQSAEDDFFHTLAGKTNKQNSALILREIIKEQIEINHALLHHEKADTPLNADTQIREIKKKLTRNSTNLIKNDSWFANFKDSALSLFSGFNTLEAVGAFASFSFAIVGVIILFNNTGDKLSIDHYSIQIENNHETIVINTQSPNDLIQILESELKAINTNFSVEKINQYDWHVELKPKSQQEIQQIQVLLESIDSDVLHGIPPYYIHIKKE